MSICYVANPAQHGLFSNPKNTVAEFIDPVQELMPGSMNPAAGVAMDAVKGTVA